MTIGGVPGRQRVPAGLDKPFGQRSTQRWKSGLVGYFLAAARDHQMPTAACTIRAGILTQRLPAGRGSSPSAAR